MPWLWLLLLHALLLLARLELGRWPHRFGQDDPKTIPLVRHLHGAVDVAMLLIPLAVVTNAVVVVVLLMAAFLHREGWRGAMFAASMAAAAWVLFVAAFSWDPAAAVVWFFD